MRPNSSSIRTGSESAPGQPVAEGVRCRDAAPGRCGRGRPEIVRRRWNGEGRADRSVCSPRHVQLGVLVELPAIVEGERPRGRPGESKRGPVGRGRAATAIEAQDRRQQGPRRFRLDPCPRMNHGECDHICIDDGFDCLGERQFAAPNSAACCAGWRACRSRETPASRSRAGKSKGQWLEISDNEDNGPRRLAFELVGAGARMERGVHHLLTNGASSSRCGGL